MFMKKLSFYVTIMVMVAMCSCSSSNEPKEISPTSTEFTSGELAKLIEVVDEPCQLIYAEKEGGVGSQFFRLKVKLKLIKESPELKEIDARDIRFKGWANATINLIDKNETTIIEDLEVKSEDVLKLKKLLKGDEGDEEMITFEKEFHNSDDAPKWFEQVSAFTPYSTCDNIAIGNEEASNLSKSFRINGSHEMHGTVDKYPITMNIEIEESEVKGSLYYDKNGPNAILKLSGSNDDGIIEMNETENGRPTGNFKGKFSNGILKGTYTTIKGKSMPFFVSENGASSNSFSSDGDESLNDSDNFTMDEGDVSVDEFLDEYEKFWRTYVNYMKKLDQSNPTAMIEYAKLLQQYNSYNKKLQNIKGHMSIDQLNRINQMNLELMQEMDKIKQ